MNVKNNMTELIGQTPLVRLLKVEAAYKTEAHILAKLEYFNPTGSVKDRAAIHMIEMAEKQGLLKPDGVIVEPTSGNTGIGLAAVAAVKGYRCVLTMPETMSVERRNLLKAYGAKIVLTSGKEGMQGAIAQAKKISAELGAFMPSQFTNKANAEAHRLTTGPEIWTNTDGKIDILVACVGTGGTISGTGEYLKEKNPAIQVIAVEPAGSPVLSEGMSGTHKIQGIGAGFVPEVLDTKVYDEIITATDENALDMARMLPGTEGILVGISSGAALYAAVVAAKRPENTGKNVVVIFPDTGERYLSTELFAE